MGQQTIRFSNKTLFAGQTGVVDRNSLVIKGVSCITGGLEAEGHSLFVDSTTVTQLQELAVGMGQVPVTLDHDGGIGDVNGWLDNFRQDGDKLRADWHLLESHPETPIMLERAEKQPSTFGLSFSFKGDPKGTKVGNRACARAEKIMSCDVVKRAAANPGGLFSAKEEDPNRTIKLAIIAAARGQSVDRKNYFNFSNMDANNPSNTEPTNADILAAFQQLSGRLEAAEAQNAAIINHLNGQGQQEEGEGQSSDQDLFDQLTAFNNATDEELAAYNQQNGTQITRADIDAAVGEYNASIGGEQGQEGDDSGITEQANAEGAGGAAQMAGAAAGGGAEGSTAFRAMQRELIQLKSRINARDRNERLQAENIQFEAIDQNMELLATQRDQAIQLAERLVAENEALQLHVRTGTRPVRAGIDNGIRLFSANGNGELHQFQQRVKALVEAKTCKSEAEAIKFASKENPALHADFLQSLEIRA
jgi:hypothetical protein